MIVWRTLLTVEESKALHRDSAMNDRLRTLLRAVDAELTELRKMLRGAATA